uniref:rRNA-processing protein EFG1 n=1 Tax=Tetraselmis sp. GSL018 TaxID=582737 RepID=A0A061S769_9CHLO|mmetsp:Transcript_32721/g.77600  ORF Transcript_32721/g.77600 Transcript_32721/m.77600 type:complete len:468 (-) Transcript_32721:406-1809(-)
MKSIQPRTKFDRNNTSSTEKRRSKRSFKSLIRGCERVLAKDNLEPRARAAQELKLRKLKEEHEKHVKSERERKLAIRYHKVKFFERRKIERLVGKLEKLRKHAILNGDEDEVKRSTESLADAKDKLLYVTHFPKGEKYVSVLKGEGEHIEAERRRLMRLVKEQLREMALVTEADEGLGLGDDIGKATGEATPAGGIATPSQTAGPPQVEEPAARPRGSRRKPAPKAAAPTGEEVSAAVPGSNPEELAKGSAREAAGQEQCGPAAKAAPPASAEAARPGRALSVDLERPAEGSAHPEASAAKAPASLGVPLDEFAEFDDFFLTDAVTGELPASRPAPAPVPMDSQLSSDEERGMQIKARSQKARRAVGLNSRGGGEPAADRNRPRAPRRAHSKGQAPGKKTRDARGKAGSGRAETAFRPGKSAGVAKRAAGKVGARHAAPSGPSTGGPPKQPLRTRAEGGRKRRPKKK